MTSDTSIINTDIISDKYNVFWEDISNFISGMNPLDTLVISLPIAGDAEKQQLQKMLQACGLSPTDYNLVELAADQNIAWHQLRDGLKCKNVVLLGVEPAQLGVSVYFMPHQVNRFNDCCWIPTLSIPQLEQNTDVKKHLWNYGLKPVFVEKAHG